jgi:hypothetical protein
MSLLPIRYVSFNSYGTLIDFRVGDVARDRLADRVPPGRMAGFLEDFTAYRFPRGTRRVEAVSRGAAWLAGADLPALRIAFDPGRRTISVCDVRRARAVPGAVADPLFAGGAARLKRPGAKPSAAISPVAVLARISHTG